MKELLIFLAGLSGGTILGFILFALMSMAKQADAAADKLVDKVCHGYDKHGREL